MPQTSRPARGRDKALSCLPSFSISSSTCFFAAVVAAARILAHQEPLEILDDSVAARLIAAAAQMGLLPT